MNCNDENQKENLKSKKDTNELDKINDDWESKYDLSIEILKEEYLQSLIRIRNVDEKANKYSLVISILVAGTVAVLSSKSIDNLNFQNSELTISFTFSIFFSLTAIASLWFGFRTVKALLKCLNLVEVSKMPNMLETLKETSTEDIIFYKHHIIKSFQKSINLMAQTALDKQLHLRNVAKNINFFVVALIFSFIILTLIRLLR